MKLLTLMGLFSIAHGRPLDFGILIDSSPDIRSQHWDRILFHIQQIVDGLRNISPSPYGTRVGIVSYASAPYLHMSFDYLQGASLNKAGVRRLIGTIRRQPGNERRIDRAVDFVRMRLFSPLGGVRPGSYRVFRNSFLFTCKWLGFK